MSAKVRKLGLMIAVVSLMGVTGCSSNTHSVSEPVSPSPKTSTSPSLSSSTVSPSPSGVSSYPVMKANQKTGFVDVCANPQTPFTGPAADQFGATAVMDAYCTWADRILNDGFNQNLMRQHTGFTVNQFASWTNDMTSREQKDWNTHITQIVHNNIHAGPIVWGLTYYNVFGAPGEEYQFASPTQSVLHNEVTPAAATLSTDPATGAPELVLKFAVNTDFLVAKTSAPKTRISLGLYKMLTLHLDHAGPTTNPWLLNSFTVQWRQGLPKTLTTH